MNKEKLLILAVLVIGFSLRIFTTSCYSWDEFVYLQHADIISGKIDNYNEFDFRPPLVPILISIVYLFWHSTLAANILITLFSTLSILLAYLAGKEIFSKKVGITAAILLAFWPMHIYLSKMLLVHTTALFFGLLFLLFVKKAEKSGKNLLFLIAGASIALAILTRFTYIILIPLAALNFLLFRKKYSLKNLLALSAGTIALLLPYFIWAKTKYGDFLYTIKMGRLITDWSTKQSPMFYLENLYIILGLLGILGLLAWAVFKIMDKKISREEIFLLSWIILPLAYLSTMPHKEIRYMAILLIPIVLLSAEGFNRIYSSISNKKIAWVLFIILIMSCLAWTYTPYPRYCNTDAEFVSSWIMNNTKSTDVIYAQEDFPQLAYYTDRKVVLAPFDKTVFFDTNKNYMPHEGYYIYFERQNENSAFPSLDELKNDSRFILFEELDNNEGIFVFRLNQTEILLN